MKGDFSTWQFKPRENINGVLFQQGRVMRDADLTESDLIALAWQDQTARDIIGAKVAAVPAAEADGFKVVAAAVSGTPAAVHVQVTPGRVWADGQLVYLEPAAGTSDTTPVDRVATYLGAPFNSPVPAVSAIDATDRDAVVLEICREELNGFQPVRNVTAPDGTGIELIDRLLEPALGGPDTAERVITKLAFRLVRLAADDDCLSIVGRIQDDPSTLGKLTATLTPATTIPGDCPVVKGGGYTGFEHNLYRIEIAACDDAIARFKWSQFNGGLVGRATFATTGGQSEFTITANYAGIINSGITDFYLETVVFDPALGLWRVACGVPVTLTSEHKLRLTASPVYGSFSGLSSSATTFFRLWNGIRSISDFTTTPPTNPLQDGIQLVFDAPTGTNYRPGDYWYFTVRAGEVLNPITLVSAQPPAGPVYSRVPLAELEWNAALSVSAADGTIDDCRRRFRPLINQKVCCTFLVGDGVSSFGDFNSLEEAAEHLPSWGGELCLLPGTHYANLVLENASNVTIHGCARHTVVMPHAEHPDLPIIYLKGGKNLTVSDLDLISLAGTAIIVEGTITDPVEEVCISDTRQVVAVQGIRADQVSGLQIARNQIYLLDTDSGLAGISVLADDAVIERNTVVVWPADLAPPAQPGGDPNQPNNPANPCANPAEFYANIGIVMYYTDFVWSTSLAEFIPGAAFKAIGGIHLRGGCERVRVLQNTVLGGAGNGVTLGGMLSADDSTAFVPKESAAVVETTEATAPSPGGAMKTGNTVSAASTPQITIESDVVYFYVQDTDGKPLSDIDVMLTDGTSWSGQTNAAGEIRDNVPAGTYDISVSTGWTITKVEQATDPNGLSKYTVTLAKGNTGDASLSNAFPFLHEITIQENDIGRMGLSAIGSAANVKPANFSADLIPPTNLWDYLLFYVDLLLDRLMPRELLRLANFVRDLVIRGNRLHDCVTTPFDDLARKWAGKIGRGGISIALVDGAVISENHIYRNGPRGTDPICGIFIGFGNDLEITDNTLAENGAATADYEANKLEGLRGGIVVRFASTLTAQLSYSTGRKPALRIHDNRIDQPTGRALTATAFGPVSIANNHFNAEHTGRDAVWDQLIGGVLLLNLGGLHRLLQKLFGTLLNQLNYGTVSSATGAKRTTYGRSLPGGETLFNDNQLRVSDINQSYIASLIAVLDDLSYASNQTSVFKQDMVFADSVLAGFTVRATSNRFVEDVDHTWSLLTYALMAKSGRPLRGGNITALNQADHCIIALPRESSAGADLPTIASPNQVFDPSYCLKFAEKDGMKAYLLRFIVAIAQQQGVALADPAAALDKASTGVLQGTAHKAVRRLNDTQVGQQQVFAAEGDRLQAKYSDSHPYVVQMKEKVAAYGNVARDLQQSAAATGINVVQPTEKVAVVDGVVFDATTQTPRAGSTVELARADGTKLGIKTQTDAQGYYAFKLDENTAAKLGGEGSIVAIAVDDSGRSATATPTPVSIKLGEVSRQPVIAQAKRGATPEFGRPKTVFSGAPIPREPARSIPSADVGTMRKPTPGVRIPPAAFRPSPSVVRPTAPDTPSAPPPPAPSPKPGMSGTPLENIKGIGPVRAQQLRKAGIPDVETLMATDSKKLVDIAGFDADVVKRAGAQALKKAALEAKKAPDRKPTR